MAEQGSAKMKAILDCSVSKEDTAKDCELIYCSHLILQDIVGKQMSLNVKSGREV